MNKIEQHIVNSPQSRNTGDEALQELQTIWDSMNQRVDDIISRSDAQPLRIDPQCGKNLRLHKLLIVFYCLSTCCLLSATVFWACNMWRYTSCIQVTAAALLLETVFLMATAFSIYATVMTLRWENPILLKRYIPQITTTVIAILLVLPFVTNGQTGDGLVMSQCNTSALNHSARMETIQTINKTLNPL